MQNILNNLYWLVHTPAVHAGLVGLWIAVLHDLNEFRKWQPTDPLIDAKGWKWQVAAVRYVQGFVGGLISIPILGVMGL